MGICRLFLEAVWGVALKGWACIYTCKSSHHPEQRKGQSERLKRELSKTAQCGLNRLKRPASSGMGISGVNAGEEAPAKDGDVLGE